MMKWVVGRFRPPPGITWEKRGMDMRITDLSFMQGYIRMATDGANMGCTSATAATSPIA